MEMFNAAFAMDHILATSNLPSVDTKDLEDVCFCMFKSVIVISK